MVENEGKGSLGSIQRTIVCDKINKKWVKYK